MIEEITIKDIEQMIQVNDEDKKYSESLTRDLKNRINSKEIADNSLIEGLARMVAEDRHTSGMLVDYPHGTVIQQAKRRYYYRGESSIYPSSRSSIFRNVPKDPIEKYIYYFISEMKIYEFKKLIDNFDVVNKWPSDVLYDGIAQHYGIPTNLLDITNDFEVALFFACCKYDRKIKGYRPLKESDLIEEKDRYGVIFKTDSLTTDLSQSNNIIEGKPAIIPIGYQPFMRCHRQYGYVYDMKENDDLYKDDIFQIKKFKHSLELSKEIFYRMEGGKKIFPNEGLQDIYDEIEQINQARIFSKEAFNNVLSKLKFNGLDIDIKKELHQRNIHIGQSPIKLSRQRIRKINRDYEKMGFLKEMPLPLHYRKIYIPEEKDSLYISINYETIEKKEKK